MEITVSKNKWEILRSGYVVVEDGDSVDFVIDNLRFKLSFETEDGVEPRVGLKYEKEEKFMSIICQNFENSSLRTVSQPLIVAQKDGRDIALEISVTSTARESQEQGRPQAKGKKILFYCWCISKEATEWHSG